MRPAAVLLGLVPLTFGGCLGVQTTQEKSTIKAAAAARHRAEAEKGLSITKLNAGVKVVEATVLQDPNGVAAVVHLRNTGPAQVALPLGITVADAKGAKLYANDLPGLDPSLVSLAALGKGQETYWVNNQILVAGKAESLTVKVGAAKASSAPLPAISVTALRAAEDADGAYVKGELRNTSSTVQPRLTVYCVARAGATVRAAGRAVIERLAPTGAGRPTAFTVFFIGDPQAAKVQCTAPPTALAQGAAK